MTTSGVGSSSKIQMDYMKLLVTQLQNQNPLEPMDNNDMASQLAQFSQLNQMESLNENVSSMSGAMGSNFAQALDYVNRSYASSLIDKEVSFLTGTEDGGYEQMSGTVGEVFNDPEKGILLVVENAEGVEYTLGLDGVISVK